jgi:hypothetical protein
MSTSRHEGRILLAADFAAENDQFCDTVYLKHGLINGLNHLADEWSQVRANVMVPDLALATGTFTSSAKITGGSDDTDTWFLWLAWKIPVTVIEPGTPHLFRFWIAATSDDSGMDFELRAVLVPDGTPLDDSIPLEESDSVWASDLIAAIDPLAYATGATLGDEAYASAIVMPATSSGPTMGTLAVYAKTTSDTGNLDLIALHLSEVVPV